MKKKKFKFKFENQLTLSFILYSYPFRNHTNVPTVTEHLQALEIAFLIESACIQIKFKFVDVIAGPLRKRRLLIMHQNSLFNKFLCEFAIYRSSCDINRLCKNVKFKIKI